MCSLLWHQPVFVVRDRVLFPGGLLRLSVGKPKSVRLVESLLTKRDDHHQHQHQSNNNNAGPTILLAIFTQRHENKKFAYTTEQQCEEIMLR